MELELTEDFKIYQGFHSYREPPIESDIPFIEDNPLFEDDSLYVECTIPKGSTYYINRIDEIVSDSIIVNKILDI